jgi:hypothetical protein
MRRPLKVCYDIIRTMNSITTGKCYVIVHHGLEIYINNISVQFFVCLRAELKSQRPIAESARIQNNKNEKQISKKRG